MVVLLIVSIGITNGLLVGIQKIKQSAKQSFSYSLSDTDLIVGSRSGDIQLLLYTVFRIGQPTANMSWQSFQDIKNLKERSWIIPLSLGDSHKGYPVLGTSSDYFTHYKYGNKKNLTFLDGRRFNTPFEIVLGYDVAKKLNYKLNDVLYLSHGMFQSRLSLHKNKVFKVVGILKKTATPVDKTLHIPLEGMTALHLQGNNETILNSSTNLEPQSITGCLVGLKSKLSIFNVQRNIQTYRNEALMAIIPGVTLSQLWKSIQSIDLAFMIITVLVIIIAFLGLLLALFMSLNNQKRELAILRTLGAHPLQLAVLLSLESLVITANGVMLGLAMLFFGGNFFGPFLEQKLGLILSLNTLTLIELKLSVALIIFGLLISLIPARLAYKKSLSEGFISL